MEERMKNWTLVLDINQAIQSLQAPIYQSGLLPAILGYVGLRVGQMTNCKFAINQAFVRAEGNTAALEQLDQVSEWKTSEAFGPAERTALELTEAVTELKNEYNSVSDELWNRVEEHFNEKEYAALLLFISAMNMFARMNVATRRLS